MLRTDPVLQRVIGRNFNSWKGEANDIFGPTPATCPYLQLADKPSGSAWETEGMHATPYLVTIAVAVNGSDSDQIRNLWGAVRRALWPLDPARSLAVKMKANDARITKSTLTLSGVGVKLQEQGGRILIAQGQLKLFLMINTP